MRSDSGNSHITSQAARSAPLEKGLSNRPGKIHSHEKETVYFLPGRVGFTNNFDLPRGTNLIRISLPRLWLQLFRCGACLSGRASATVILRCKFGFEQLSGHPGLSTTIAKSIRLDKMSEILYYYWFYWSQNQYRWLPGISGTDCRHCSFGKQTFYYSRVRTAHNRYFRVRLGPEPM